MEDPDVARIRIYEQYGRGEKTELREALGDDVVDSMKTEAEEFESAMNHDTTVFISNNGK